MTDTITIDFPVQLCQFKLNNTEENFERLPKSCGSFQAICAFRLNSLWGYKFVGLR